MIACLILVVRICLANDGIVDIKLSRVDNFQGEHIAIDLARFNPACNSCFSRLISFSNSRILIFNASNRVLLKEGFRRDILRFESKPGTRGESIEGRSNVEEEGVEGEVVVGTRILISEDLKVAAKLILVIQDDNSSSLLA